MTALSAHQSSQTTKMLLIGDSGAGKSGALASLASAGYNLRIIDVDNGLDVLANYLKDPSSGYRPDALDRVQYETITDPMRTVGGKLIPVRATVWSRTVELLNDWSPKTTIKWPEKAEANDTAELGPISSWGIQDVLVIDSLTMMAKAAMNFVLAMNARLGQQAHQSDWYQGQQLLESLLEKLYDVNIRCNVVINCHITYIGEENGPQRGYPSSLGRALSPRIGRYFNSILMAKTVGSGAGAKHKILTSSTPMVELKNTAPLKVKGEYELGNGLAEYFRDVRGASASTSQGLKP